MTYSQCWIRVLDEPDVDFGSRRSSVIMLGPPKELYWLPTLRVWAEERSLTIHYRDSSWIEVAATLEDVLEFLKFEMDEGAKTRTKIGRFVSNKYEFVLVVEEY